MFPVLQCKLVASDEVTGRAFVDAFEEVPVVLMSEGGATDEVMRAVTLGAVDFLDKPLSLLKLKNIWQHSVRRMMQRTSLCDSSPRYGPSAPAFSEPVGAITQAPSVSNCLPSSMTAPIALVPPPAKRRSYEKPTSGMTAPAARRSSVDSPGTPSAGDAEFAEDSVSAGSAHQLDHPSFFSHGKDGSSGGLVDNTLLDGESKITTRAPMSSKPSSFGPLVPVPPLSQWPQLPSGCVWGTPVGGPLPPPLPNAASPVSTTTASAVVQCPGAPTLAPLRVNTTTAAAGAPSTATSTFTSAAAPSVLLKSSRSTNSIEHISLPSLCATVGSEPSKVFPSSQPIPEGFLCLSKAKEEATTGLAPLGLKLRKSHSLLDLINATLSTSSGGSEATAVTTIHAAGTVVGGKARSF